MAAKSNGANDKLGDGPSQAEVLQATLEHMKTKIPSFDVLVKLDAKTCASYADPIARKYAKSAEFCKGQDAISTAYGDWNQTALCNAAYMSLYAAEKRDAFAKQYQGFLAWYESRLVPTVQVPFEQRPDALAILRRAIEQLGGTVPF